MSGQRHAPAALTSGFYWIGGWVGPNTVGYRCDGEEKKFGPYQTEIETR
jgi:hypothetical protein